MNADKTRSSWFLLPSNLRLLGAIFCAGSVLIGISGCSKRYSDLPAFNPFPFRDTYNYSVGRFKTTYLADQIHAYFKGRTAGPIAVATFVDIDNLYSSSTFGRLLSEQLMSELAMRGYNVIEVRQSEALQVMFDQGEMALSRDVSALRNSQNVSAMVVGTYTVSPVRVYLNARLIDPDTSLVVSVGSVELPKTGEIDRLLRANLLPPSLERIPVRNLSYHYAPSSYVPGWGPARENTLPSLEEKRSSKAGKNIPEAKLSTESAGS